MFFVLSICTILSISFSLISPISDHFFSFSLFFFIFFSIYLSLYLYISRAWRIQLVLFGKSSILINIFIFRAQISRLWNTVRTFEELMLSDTSYYSSRTYTSKTVIYTITYSYTNTYTVTRSQLDKHKYSYISTIT